MNLRQIRIRQVKPAGPHVLALAGDGIIVPVGDGGWSPTLRPKRKGFVEWAGNNVLTMDVPILLDGWADGKSIEADVRALEAMHRNAQGPLAEPPVVAVDGATVPHANLTWVLNNLTFGDVIRRDRDGARVRQYLTLGLLEYAAGDVLVQTSSAAKRQHERNKQQRGGANRSAHTYRVKHGDTLGSIAVALYKDRNRWHDIAKLNNLRDPNHLKVGSVLRLP